jgi:hypothetical protein
MDAINHAASQRVASAVAPSADDLKTLREHPRFAEALRVVAAGLVDVYDGNRLLNQVLNDRGRVVLGLMALYLHFSRKPGGNDGGLTASRMMTMCADTGLCSPNRAGAMIALMRFGGYLEAAPGGLDRRAKVLVPTAHMIAVHRQRMEYQFRAIALLLPEGQDALDRLPELEFIAALSRQMGDRYRAGWRAFDYMPELTLFADRNAGLVIALSLLLAGQPDDTFPPTRVRVSISALARRFAVSRAHVLKLLRDAERHGFVRRGGEQGEAIELLPPLIEAVQAFFARIFLYFADCTRSALAEPEIGKAERVAIEQSRGGNCDGRAQS